MPSRAEDYRNRYQESAVATGRFMREAGEHIAANEELDLTPDALIEEINSIQAMLNEAKYYATRMQVYQNLLDGGNLCAEPSCHVVVKGKGNYCRYHEAKRIIISNPHALG